MNTPENGDLKFKKVAQVRIFEHAVEQIREQITNGRLTPGSKLPTEQELSKHLNVSRSSIREALRVLEAEGLVEVRRGYGTIVSTQPAGRTRASQAMDWLVQREETIEQVLEVRERIEGLAAFLAATHATQASLSEIESILQEQSRQIQASLQSEEIDYEGLARLDAMFHLALGAAGGNDIANEIITRIVPAFNESNKAVMYVSRRIEKMEREHRAILNALESKDPQAAENALRDHIRSVRKVILDLVEEN